MVTLPSRPVAMPGPCVITVARRRTPGATVNPTEHHDAADDSEPDPYLPGRHSAPTAGAARIIHHRRRGSHPSQQYTRPAHRSAYPPRQTAGRAALPKRCSTAEPANIRRHGTHRVSVPAAGLSATQVQPTRASRSHPGNTRAAVPAQQYPGRQYPASRRATTTVHAHRGTPQGSAVTAALRSTAHRNPVLGRKAAAPQDLPQQGAPSRTGAHRTDQRPDVDRPRPSARSQASTARGDRRRRGCGGRRARPASAWFTLAGPTDHGRRTGRKHRARRSCDTDQLATVAEIPEGGGVVLADSSWW